VQLLLAHGAQVDAPSLRHGHALQAASDGGHVEVVKLLINADAEVNTQGGTYGCTLDLAIGNDHTTLVTLLLGHGADLETTNHDGGTPLTFAAHKDYLETVKLLPDHGAGLSAASNKDWTALNTASNNGHLEIVKLLVSNGVDITKTDKDGWIPVYSAADSGHADMVRLLLAEGADLSIANFDGWTPLIASCTNGHLDVVELLLDHEDSKDSLHVTSKIGDSALFRAVAKGHTDIVRYILAKGAVPTQESVYGLNTLASAAAWGHDAILALLLAVPGIGANFRNRSEGTPMWWASAYDRVDTVELLLKKYQGDSAIVDSCGRTSLAIATKRGSWIVIEFLQKRCGTRVSDDDILLVRIHSKRLRSA
jgi:ankyrin repeat protein